MRALVLIFLSLAFPASAWEFSPTPICTLADDNSPTSLRITYDGAIYRMTLTHPHGWQSDPVFSIRFAPNGPVISTNRHIVSGADLTVADSGFGNVFLGLENNSAAIATLGALARVIDLTGAAEPVAAFRNCMPTVPTS